MCTLRPGVLTQIAALMGSFKFNDCSLIVFETNQTFSSLNVTSQDT